VEIITLVLEILMQTGGQTDLTKVIEMFLYVSVVNVPKINHLKPSGNCMYHLF
jgi:hypothetical protein